MQRILYSLLLAFLLPVIALSQGGWVSSSIDQGSQPNTVALYIRSTNALDAGKCNNIVFTLRVPLSAGPSLALTEVYHAPAFSHLAFNIQKLHVTDGNYYYFLVSGTGSIQAPSGQMIEANTSFPVLELRFNGIHTSLVELVNLENDIPGNVYIRPQFYIQNNMGDITRYSEIFYGTAVNNEPGTGNDWASTHASVALPFAFLSFEVAEHGMDALMTWHVAQENDITDEYDVERSISGQPFIAIATIKARINNASRQYMFTDEQAGRIAADGSVSYRIRHKDIDGRQAVSAIETAHFDNPQNEFTIYPNPAVNSTTLMFQSDKAGIANICIISSNGKTVQSVSKPIIQGHNRFMLDLKKLPAGQYSIVLTANGIRKTTGLIKPLL